MLAGAVGLQWSTVLDRGGVLILVQHRPRECEPLERAKGDREGSVSVVTLLRRHPARKLFPAEHSAIYLAAPRAFDVEAGFATVSAWKVGKRWIGASIFRAYIL